MKKPIPIVLWLLVLIVGGATLLMQWNRSSRESEIQTVQETPSSGAVLVDVPWKHLQHVPEFELTNQEGEAFRYSDIIGKPMVVSFFFAGCPSICRDLNDQIKRLHDQLDGEDVVFLSITVDPENDTPEILNRYAKDYEATTDQWVFATGKPHKVREIGEQVFRVVVDRDTHTDNILLIDRWGKYRDRFKWDDPYDMKRFIQVAQSVISETEPPMDATVRTRNAMAGTKPDNWDTVPWIRDFFLTTSNGNEIYSRELTGETWIGNFFFTSCPGVCIEQSNYLAGLQERLKQHPAKIVSITTDPQTDTPQVLSEYARKRGAQPDQWLFATVGEDSLTKRISSEFFRAPAGNSHHSSELFVVDRWGNVRGRFDWRQPNDEVRMFQLIDELNSETVPPGKFSFIQPTKSSNTNEETKDE
ncbi:MAG: SCO family protein [Planctomycetota bacterium]|nr:SCO family protein [Planctomycetota bacterium]